MLGITALETQASKSTVQLQQTGDRRCASIAHRPDRGDRGCHRCRCPEPDAGARTPELCPYRLNNSLGWGNCIRAPPCPPLCNTVARGMDGPSLACSVAPADPDEAADPPETGAIPSAESPEDRPDDWEGTPHV